MPAPLAKGLIISLSLLFACGAALYENPQVRQWVDESRRKIAVALHSLGDEIQPPRSPSRPPPSDDPSTREDNSPEAVERRRKAREEILQRGRVMEERRQSKTGERARGQSFDDMVDPEGRLKRKAEDSGVTTSSDVGAVDDGMRKRHVEAAGAALGANTADPFSDEMQIDFMSEKQGETFEMPTEQSRESTVTLPATTPQQGLLIDTEMASNHPSELLVDLTPTSSAASSSHDDLSELSDIPPEVQQPTTYSSVNEWAQNSINSFYSPPESLAGDIQAPASRTVSEIDNDDHFGNLSDVDVVSELGESINTPGSWTEVGSVVSDDGR